MQLRADVLRLIRKAWDNKASVPELGNDSSKGDIIMSTKRFTSLASHKKMDLEHGEHSKAMDKRDRKRKRATLDISYSAPTTRRTAKKIKKSLTV
ncbi:hypothetical protein ANO14919_104110 [Xylariales sp. No.14919]|nr:hypothetical protein ANO14919_104110 [Xylariales sp. No.14919]